MPSWADPPDFALIGHQETWDQISRIVHTLRTSARPPLAHDTLREIVPWIPPRRMLRTRIRSLPDGATVNGVYIETFITPDELRAGALRSAVDKVRDALRCAARQGVRVVALGGFTSIVLEGREPEQVAAHGPALTTGNTLTAALIARGLERAAARQGVPLAEASLLIAGATGDVGSACARYFARRTGRLLLSARRKDRLARLAAELETAGARVEVRPVLDALPEADAVIAAASLAEPVWDLTLCRPGAIVCDAGYPKNLRPAQAADGTVRVFHGGMGLIEGGWSSDSPLLDSFYGFPLPFIGHGCLLEAIVLAMEHRYEPFSRGRGNITPQRIEEIWGMAARHGVGLAPFFNHEGLWAHQLVGAAR